MREFSGAVAGQRIYSEQFVNEIKACKSPVFRLTFCQYVDFRPKLNRTWSRYFPLQMKKRKREERLTTSSEQL